MFKMLTGLAATILLSTTALAQDDSATADADAETRMELARETMRLSGGEGIMAQMLDIMTPTLRPALMQQYPEASDDQVSRSIDLIAQSFQDASPELLEASARVYAENFTAEEIDAINDFYRTPVGAKLTELLPTISQEASLAGQRTATRVMMEINPQVRAIMTEGAGEPESEG